MLAVLYHNNRHEKGFTIRLTTDVVINIGFKHCSMQWFCVSPLFDNYGAQLIGLCKQRLTATDVIRDGVIITGGIDLKNAHHARVQHDTTPCRIPYSKIYALIPDDIPVCCQLYQAPDMVWTVMDYLW
jgi:hypothetical protein